MDITQINYIIRLYKRKKEEEFLKLVLHFHLDCQLRYPLRKAVTEGLSMLNGLDETHTKT